MPLSGTLETTQLSLDGGVGLLHGDFSFKSGGSKTYTETFTQLGLDGGSAALYNGVFADAATDSVSAADAADRSGDVQSLAADTITVLDVATAAGGALTADASDSVNATDVATAAQLPIVPDRAGTRTLRPGRTPYSLGRFYRPRLDVFSASVSSTASDAVTPTDASATQLVGVAAAADAVAASDSANTAGVSDAAASDVVNATDTADGAAADEATATDATSAADTADAIIVSDQFAAEVLALVDIADTSLVSGGNLSATDALAQADTAVTDGSVYSGDALEAVTAIDAATAQRVGVFNPSANSRVRVDSKARVTKGRIGGRRI